MDENIDNTVNFKSQKCLLDVFSTNFIKSSIFLLKQCNTISCPPSFFLCRNEGYCISIELVCDGINHCFLEDDEKGCGEKLFLIYFFVILRFFFLFFLNRKYNF